MKSRIFNVVLIVFLLAVLSSCSVGEERDPKDEYIVQLAWYETSPIDQIVLCDAYGQYGYEFLMTVGDPDRDLTVGQHREFRDLLEAEC